MKEFYIGQMRTDDEIQDYFMVKAIAIKIGSNKKQYLDMILCDNSGELTAKKWDVADPELPALNEISEGDIVKLKGSVTEWNGMRQLRVLKLRKAVPEDNVELMDYIKAAPEKGEDMYLNQIAKSLGINRALAKIHLKKLERGGIVKSRVVLVEGEALALRYYELQNFDLHVSPEILKKEGENYEK